MALVKPAKAPNRPERLARERSAGQPEDVCLSENFETTPIWYEDGGLWWHYQGGQPDNAVGDYYWLDTNCDAFDGSWGCEAIMGGTYGGSLPCDSTYDYSTDSWLEFAPWITCLAGAPGAYLDFYGKVYTQTGLDYFYYLVSVDGQDYLGYKISGSLYNTWYNYNQNMRAWAGLGDLTAQPQLALAFVFQSGRDIPQSFTGFGVRLDKISIVTTSMSISSVSKLGSPFRLSLTGGGFLPGAWVYINGASGPRGLFQGTLQSQGQRWGGPQGHAAPRTARMHHRGEPQRRHNAVLHLHPLISFPIKGSQRSAIAAPARGPSREAKVGSGKGSKPRPFSLGFSLLHPLPISRSPAHSLRQPHLAQDRGVIAPIGADLHEEPELHAAPQELLDLLPGGHADGFERLAPVSDDDGLLAVSLDQDGAVDRHLASLLLRFVEGFDEDAHAVGDLLPRAGEDVLAHHLRRELSLGLVRVKLGREEGLLLGQEREEQVQQPRVIPWVQRAQRVDGRVREALAQIGHERQELALVPDPVHLVEGQDQAARARF